MAASSGAVFLARIIMSEDKKQTGPITRFDGYTVHCDSLSVGGFGVSDWVVKISHNGRIELAEGLDLDEASERFWDKIASARFQDRLVPLGRGLMADIRKYVTGTTVKDENAQIIRRTTGYVIAAEIRMVANFLEKRGHKDLAGLVRLGTHRLEEDE